MENKTIGRVLIAGRPSLMRISMQFFAEGDGAANTPPANTDPAGTGTNTKDEPAKPPKTFTQDEVNAMMAKEKAQGKLSILKELGIEDAKTAKDGITKYNEWLESQKTELQKATDATSAEKLAREALAKENANLKFKVEAITLGVKPECVDAMAAIVATSMTDGSDPKEILNGLKAKPEYKGFFEDGSDGDQPTGTGANVGSRKQVPPSTDGLGKRLGTSAAQGSDTKSSYFSH